MAVKIGWRTDGARLAALLGLAAAGGFLFDRLGLPAGWVSGAMIAVAVAALAGVSAPVPGRLRDVVFFVLGLSMGSGVTPDLVGRLGDWPISLAGLAVTVAGTTVASYLWLRRVAGWDAPSAFFGAIPGALTMTLATAAQSRANLVQVSLAQTLRLLMLVAVLPLAVTSLEGVPPAPSAPVAVAGPVDLAILVIAGGAAALAAERLRIPAGLLLGAFAVSGLLHGLDLVHGQLPPAVILPAFVAMGCFLGLRFAGSSLSVVGGALAAGLGSFLAAFAVAAAGAAAVALLTGLPVGQVVVAFAPGGLEVMVVLAFLLQVDPAFVAGHHFARFVAMTVLVPWLAGRVLGRDWNAPTPDEGRGDSAASDARR